ncbi:hypothetical protein H8N03_13250 [Ramlibacter sp. USB13]|uniref:Uncharacterized protein n=1 Tax=Ramlibacter cellulosilyticus TaxID=2764187 RepID=A0A923MS44_9BURK|nr:hypothetical protein [Ramlibacter cellulosilyticus]MBC5783916.1 hypothetical protein [Ramlibacter cellulosilyticus]
MQMFLRSWPSLAAWLGRWFRPLSRRRRGAGARDTDGGTHVSLLNVVRPRRGGRYMAVDQIVGDRAECAWVDGGVKRTGWYALSELEVVPALGPEDARWREAFRAGNHRKVG